MTDTYVKCEVCGMVVPEQDTVPYKVKDQIGNMLRGMAGNDSEPKYTIKTICKACIARNNQSKGKK